MLFKPSIPRFLVVSSIPVALLAVLLLRSSLNPFGRVKLWTVEELARYNGADDKLPILLGILGWRLPSLCRDASRAFVSGNFTDDGLTDSLRGLSISEIKSVVDWRDFYFKRYKYVGKLIGRYYNNQGTPTQLLKGVEAKAARGAQLLEKQKIEEAKRPNCNSRWSQEDGGQVWCDDGYPRLVQRPGDIALTGKISQRCACFKEDELDQPGLEVYAGCDPSSKVCVV
ncbi:membrane-associated progesterone-binding protein 4 isoform X2 [Nymphaea colorata]|uniref:membrane-associated progesterone-binding protein 4 isoform X2 n=1 Tax=Nymphaea colorata TaxID=210225 RepID=UPI00129EC142|nr:membrane-associated progesterone-binding protein 4 isoform X2 [Nymphaea colorata]